MTGDRMREAGLSRSSRVPTASAARSSRMRAGGSYRSGRLSAAESQTGRLLALVAVALGLGAVWLVTAQGGGDPAAGLGVSMGLALSVAGAVGVIAAVSASARLILGALLALIGAVVGRAPAERIDLPATITQRRPDAPGRPQPRAPGRLLAIA
jgi:hypothetical protein